MKFKPSRLSNQEIEYGKTKYKHVDLKKALPLWEAVVLSIAYSIAHNSVTDFIGFFIGGQFFIVYVLMNNGDGLQVRFLSRFPSVVFSVSQLGLQKNDIINLHNPQPLDCPKPAPGAIPLNCTVDAPSYN
jgi:hypothetical protein